VFFGNSEEREQGAGVDREKLASCIGVRGAAATAPAFGKYNMQIHTKSILAILTWTTAVWSSVHAGVNGAEVAIRQPDVAIYRMYTHDPAPSLTARHFTFVYAKDRYTLTEQNGRVIAKDIFYLKTFGGIPGTVEIHLVSDRYIVYPETIKGSDVADSRFGEMDAVTHIYDLTTGKTIWTSEKYRYEEDAPVKYDQIDIFRATRKALKAEQAGADQPATSPAEKPAVKGQPSTPTSKDSSR